MPKTAATLMARLLKKETSMEEFVRLAEALSTEERSLLLTDLLRQKATKRITKPN